MKTCIAIFAVLCLSLPALAQDLLKPSVKGPAIDDVSGSEPLEPEAAATAEGTIKAIDQLRGTVTIAHGPVPSLKWPALTMMFKASDKQLQGLSVGDEVTFSFKGEGTRASIVSIEKR